MRNRAFTVVLFVVRFFDDVINAHLPMEMWLNSSAERRS
jgi:hypothetical protein